MKSAQYNPKLRAILSIRNIVKGLQSNWASMDNIGSNLDSLLKNATSLFQANASAEAGINWKAEVDRLYQNVSSLKKILSSVTEKIRNKDAENLVSIWQNFQSFSDEILESILTLEKKGFATLPENQHENWRDIWTGARSNHSLIRSHAEACSLQLKMIEKYKPEEIDELTDTILRHIPANFTLADADLYEKDYSQAYEAIKQEASRKKNLWDKFLDILAGGVEQSPAERVMMQRWIDGEKGELS
ncbi:MAG: hypothetical protein ACRBF0_18015 [Calditrichia bacterium]